MSFFRSLIAVVTGLALVGTLAPAFAFAQYYNPSVNCGGTIFNTNNCTPGTLLVYVQILNGSGSNYAYNQQSGAFGVVVAGQNASPASFPGSASGTQVSVTGNYSVSMVPANGYTQSYSTGCNGVVVNNQQATCIVTENTSYNNGYYPFSTSYPQSYLTPSLSCNPSYQMVNVGQQVTFTAIGGSASQYNWQTIYQQYLNVGTTFTTSFPTAGTQTVTVMNNGTSATCTVNVVPFGVSTYNPTIPGIPTVTVTPTYIPRLPNTGFEPQDGATIAFALAALIAFAILALPYVRKALAAIAS